MQILVFSDSHGNLTNFKNILNKYKNTVSHVIHLGDYDEDVAEIQHSYSSYNFINIAGNCDYNTVLPTEKTFTLANKTFFITHGHRYSVKNNLVRLTYGAEEKQANICLFGHTHIPVLTFINEVLYMNPGSISQPRGNYSYSYGIIDITNENISAKIIEIQNSNKENIIMSY